MRVLKLYYAGPLGGYELDEYNPVICDAVVRCMLGSILPRVNLLIRKTEAEGFLWAYINVTPGYTNVAYLEHRPRLHTMLGTRVIIHVALAKFLKEEMGIKENQRFYWKVEEPK